MLLSAIAVTCVFLAELQNVEVGDEIRIRNWDWYYPQAFLVTNAQGNVAVDPEGGRKYTMETKRIWDAAPHNAFTDLVRWKDLWYCTFREGDGHVGGDGKIRIISSQDGDTWESVALLEEAGIDLRDPKLSITPDNRLMALMGGSVYREGKLVGMQPRVSFSGDGKEWSVPARIMADGDWLWRVTWHDGTAYGVSYGVGAKAGESAVKLVKSTDGVQWELVSDMQCDEHCNEATLRFKTDGTCIALMRRDGGDNQAWVGTSQPPYSDWKWHPCGHRLGGPEFQIATDSSMRGAARIYLDAETAKSLELLGHSGKAGQYTAIFAFNEESLTIDGVLPSGGDTSYPGMVLHGEETWISYYSSHEEKTAIYLTRIRPVKEGEAR